MPQFTYDHYQTEHKLDRAISKFDALRQSYNYELDVLRASYKEKFDSVLEEIETCFRSCR